jgi:arylsulfatase
MNRRNFLKKCGAAAAGAFVFSNKKMEVTIGGGRPNIIIILVDDMGFSDLGCFGGEIDTPRIDSLAYDGIRISHFYNTAKCAPTRTSLLSGLYWQDSGQGIDTGITMGQAMRAAGYRTLAVGKWHLNGNPVDRGFDRYFGHLSGMSDYFSGNDSWRLDSQVYSDFSGDFYATDDITNYALDFIDEAREEHSDKPFFMYLAYNAPHYHLEAWQSDIDKYRNDRFLPGWDQLRQARYDRQVAMGIIKPEWQLSPRPNYIPPWDMLSADEKDFEDKRMSAYAAMVDRLDQNVGRLKDKLRELNVDDNTLIMFMSDNGGCAFDRTRIYTDEPGTPDTNWEYGVAWANVSDTPFSFYKRNQHEGGISTPFIAHWPAKITKKGWITNQMGHLIDLMPTVLELAGWEWPEEFEGETLQPLPGKSLVPIFEGKQRQGHEALYLQFQNHRAIVKGDWKLVSDFGQPWELYRLDLDRTETNDLAAQNPGKVAELDQLWLDWWGDRGDGYTKGGTTLPPYYFYGGEEYVP